MDLSLYYVIGAVVVLLCVTEAAIWLWGRVARWRRRPH